MCKNIFFVIVFFLCFSSCKSSSTFNKKIEVSDSLKVVIDSYKDHFLKKKGHMEGVVSIKFHRFCESTVVELSHIEHWITFYRSGYPNFYSYHNDIPFLIFTGIGDNGLNTMDSMEIRKILKDISVTNMDLPPNTGFYPVWLYKQGNHTDDIFSITDTIFNSQNKEELKNKIHKYTDEVFCY